MEHTDKSASTQQYLQAIEFNKKLIDQYLAAFRSNYHLEVKYFTGDDDTVGDTIRFERDTYEYDYLKNILENIAGNLIAENLAITSMATGIEPMDLLVKGEG